MARPTSTLGTLSSSGTSINRQDWAICEEVQRGMSSRVHEHGYYAPMEDQSLDIRRYVTERVGG